MITSTDKTLYHIELVVPQGETVAIMRERLQKMLSYYYPQYQAVVTADKKNPAIEVEDTTWLSPEECELLGIDSAALDLLS